MYTAQIIDKTLVRGMLSVTVEFTDDVTHENIQEVFKTGQVQPAEWIDEQVAIKLKNLNSLEGVKDSIVVGKQFSSASVEEEVSPTTAAEEYKADLVHFEKMLRVIQRGMLSYDNADFLVLKEKLKTNFHMDYLEYF
jgi:hypothetical protein